MAIVVLLPSLLLLPVTAAAAAAAAGAWRLYLFAIRFLRLFPASELHQQQCPDAAADPLLCKEKLVWCQAEDDLQCWRSCTSQLKGLSCFKPSRANNTANVEQSS